MDWERAIEINHTALTRIVAALIAMVGLATATRLPRALHRAALKVLRPAESAVRRLIIIAARGVVVKLAASRPMPARLAFARTGGAPRASFQLFDSRKRFDFKRRRRTGPRSEPRITFLDGPSPLSPLFRPKPTVRVEPKPDDTVDATRLGRRLQAIKLALETLPQQAKRLKRWQMRRAKMVNPKFKSPLRPGLPPGHRKEAIDEVDDVLRECHALAWDALKEDSS